MQVAAQLGALATVSRPVAVYVAGGDLTNPVTFNEDVSMLDGVDLQGGWGVDDAGVWSRDIAANVTCIAPIGADGVAFMLNSMTRTSASMSGLTVRGASSDGGSAAITVANGAQPTLDRLLVIGGENASDAGVAAGIVLLGSDAGRTLPLISNSTIVGGQGYESAGIYASDVVGMELVDASVSAGPSRRGYGVACLGGCPGAVFTRARISGGDAGLGVGMTLFGDSRGVRVAESEVWGSDAPPTTPGFGTGLRLAPAGDAGSCGGATVVASTIVGMSGRDMNIGGFGVGISAACTLEVRGSTIMGAAPRGGASSMIQSWGVAVDGTASRFTDNQIWGCGSKTGQGLVLCQSTTKGVVTGLGSEVFQRNVVHSGASLATTADDVIAMELRGGQWAENNVIVADMARRSTGLALSLASPPDGGETVVVNNHIEGGGPGSLPASGSRSRGVYIFSAPGPSPVGVLMNNTILGGSAITRFAVEEAPGPNDPRVFVNNNLFGAATLYLDEGSSALSTISAVNALTNGPLAANNISADPLLVGNGDYHLGPMSPNRGAGVGAYLGFLAPSSDFDEPADSRPLPAGSPPDIGPDERN